MNFISSLRLPPALLFFQIVRHAKARAGGGVHLLGGVDCFLQLGDAVLDLRQLLVDLFLEIVNLRSGDLQNVLVELPLLIRQNRHRAADYSLKSTGTVVQLLTRTPSFTGGENVELRTIWSAASLSPTALPIGRMTFASSTLPVSETRALTSTVPSIRCKRAIGG